jgi:RimJ/RimL family protein N-acetyltransferase
MPEMILSRRVVLRKHEASLAKTMFDAVNHDRSRLRVYLPWVDLTKTVADEENYIRLMSEAWVKGTHYDYGIFTQQDHQFVGNVGLHTIQWSSRQCEMGYWIIGAYEGRGLMKEAVTALERVAFQNGFSRIEIRCVPDNIRSMVIPRALDYVQEMASRPFMTSDGREVLVFSKVRH